MALRSAAVAVRPAVVAPARIEPLALPALVRAVAQDGYIDEHLGPGGTFAQAFSGYQVREGQLALAKAIHATITDEGALLGQAPTGTGKSVAYLLPAIRSAIAKGKKIVVVTANIALQEQLVGKDLPMLRELLPWPFTWALAKGRGNYLCLDRFQEEQFIQLRSSAAEADQWNEVQQWAQLTTHGDLSELPFEPLASVRQRFTTSTDDCHGKACPSYNECFALKARRAYQAAEIVVTNYHLFFTEMVLRRESNGEPVLLPDWTVAIFDEGHRAPDIAREYFGFRITGGAVRWGARLLAPKNSKTPVINELLKAKIDAAADDYFDRLRVFGQSPDYRARITQLEAVNASELLGLLGEACDEYERTAKSDVGEDVRGKLRRAQRRCSILQHNIGAATDLWQPERFAYFIEEDAKGRVALCSKLIDVSEVLRTELFGLPHKSVIITSATIKTGDSFDYAAREFGCEDAREIDVESPFDFARNALLVVPRDMPDPTDKRLPREAYTQACATRFVETVFAAEGRTLGLFTSYRALDEAHRALLASGWEGRVLRHGDAPRTQLIREFKQDVRSVLLGTESFWEGVDVPGESLSCVVIDRLPFPTPDDPVLDAVSAVNPNSFFEWSIPRAVLKFTQAFGRLIRTRADRGVVVCLDRRVCDKPYGRQFIKSLPRGLRVSRDFGDVARFLGTGAGAAS